MAATRPFVSVAVMLQCFGKHTSGHGCISRGLGVRLRRTRIGTRAVLLSQHQRHYGKIGNYIHVERDSENKEVALVEMRRQPVNGMNTEFMVELEETLKILQNDSSYRGVILSSGNPDVFSAGLDIPNLYQKSSDHMSDLWKSVIGFWTRFYGTRMVTIAAINGHAPAGGCLIALSCDYRIMSQGNYNIGFSAVKLGMYVPYWVHELMSRSCGRRTTEKSFQMGLLYKPDEALRIGLVDEVVHPSELLNAARKQMSIWLQVPDHARVMTKEMMRAPLLEKIHSGRDREIARMTDYLRSDTVQRSIGAYIKSGVDFSEFRRLLSSKNSCSSTT